MAHPYTVCCEELQHIQYWSETRHNANAFCTHSSPEMNALVNTFAGRVYLRVPSLVPTLFCARATNSVMIVSPQHQHVVSSLTCLHDTRSVAENPEPLHTAWQHGTCEKRGWVLQTVNALSKRVWTNTFTCEAQRVHCQRQTHSSLETNAFVSGNKRVHLRR